MWYYEEQCTESTVCLVWGLKKTLGLKWKGLDIETNTLREKDPIIKVRYSVMVYIFKTGKKFRVQLIKELYRKELESRF